jgi:hypothetical protein
MLGKTTIMRPRRLQLILCAAFWLPHGSAISTIDWFGAKGTPPAMGPWPGTLVSGTYVPSTVSTSLLKLRHSKCVGLKGVWSLLGS